MMEGPLVAPGPNGVSTTTSLPIIDPTVVVDHLTNILQITLGASRQDLEAPGSLLSPLGYADTIQRCARFASENQLALYVQKDQAKASGTNGVQPSSGQFGSITETPVVNEALTGD